MADPIGFICGGCKERVFFSPWVYAHWTTPIKYKCQKCGRLHWIDHGIARECLPGGVPVGTARAIKEELASEEGVA